jgi:hypothetical protein
MIETEQEKLSSIVTRMDERLMSRKQAIMELHNIDSEEKAQEIIDEIDGDELPKQPFPIMENTDGETSREEDDNSERDESDDQSE